MKRILFSPIGGTDPISENNCKDGSLLHICRVYKPDKVILYMSKEIIEKHIKDNRYIYCLNKLCELQHRTMEYIIIERPDLEKVYEFDYFYEDFKPIIDQISEDEMEEEDELLINISSGTPSMKSGLAVLMTMSEYPCRMIQVTTPAKKMNEHTHSDFDIKELWELDDDNDPNYENRCIEISCPTLAVIKKEEMIKRHLKSYDYSAALDIAKSLSKSRREKYYNLLVMAHFRYLLNIKMVDEKIDTVPKELFPVRSGDGRKMFEYALQLQIKMLRKEYADFLRALTPLIFDLFVAVLKDSCKVNIKDYTSLYSKKDKDTGKITKVRKWDKSKLMNTEIDHILNVSYTNKPFRYEEIYSDNLKYIILKKSPDDSLIKLVKDLRSVESIIRNMAAHTIVSIDDSVIHEMTGFHAQEIMRKIKKLFTYTKISHSSDDWYAYDKMNDYIIEHI